MTSDTGVIVVSYNTRDLTLQAVMPARRATSGLDARVIVADNGSADGTVEAVRRAYPEVTVLENPDNPGYGDGRQPGSDGAAIDPSLRDERRRRARAGEPPGAPPIPRR